MFIGHDRTRAGLLGRGRARNDMPHIVSRDVL